MMLLEMCFVMVFYSVMVVVELLVFFTNMFTSAVAPLETLGKSDNLPDVNASDSKQHGKLAPSSTAETTLRHEDVNENDVQITPLLASSASRTSKKVTVVAETCKMPSEKPDRINNTFKFWKRRFSLFYKFNKGIWLDEESFYSVCPEVISSFMAEQCKSIKIAVDPFCGAGGNVIQLAKFCDKVIACDIDPVKITLAKHNAAVYGVAHKIEFIVGDFFELCDSIKGDVIVTSPPLIGPNYNSRLITEPSAIVLDKILEAGKSITSKMLLHLPKNLKKFKCVEVCQVTGLRVVKIQDVYINKYSNCMLMYVKSNTDNCRDLPHMSSVQFQQPFYYNDGRDSGKKSYRDYLSRVERSVAMC